MIGAILGFATRLIPSGMRLLSRRQSNKHDFAVARLRDTQHSWKDEFVVVSFVGIFPAAFIGFLLDPLLLYFFGVEWFKPAIIQYMGFMNDMLGEDGTQAVILGCITLAGVNGVQKTYNRHQNRKVEDFGAQSPKREVPSKWGRR